MAHDWLKAHLERCRPYARPLPEADVAATALLLIDCQNFFLHSDGGACMPRARGTVERLSSVLTLFRRLEAPIFFTAHGHEKPETDGGMLHHWWGSSIIEGTWDHALLEALAPEEGETVFAKRRYSGFVGTGLDETLRSRGVERLVIGGVMTNLCCETTARDAFCRDYRVFFLADGTATADDGFHGATLLNLAFGFAHVLTCAELEAHLSLDATHFSC